MSKPSKTEQALRDPKGIVGRTEYNKLRAELAALREALKRADDMANVYSADCARAERENKRARALLDESRKWLENFPKHEAPSNIRCWKIGIGTFLERVRAFLDPAHRRGRDEARGAPESCECGVLLSSEGGGAAKCIAARAAPTEPAPPQGCLTVQGCRYDTQTGTGWHHGPACPARTGRKAGPVADGADSGPALNKNPRGTTKT